MNYVVQSTFSLGIPIWFVWFFFIKTKTPADYQPQITKSLIVSAIWFTALLSGTAIVTLIAVSVLLSLADFSVEFRSLLVPLFFFRTLYSYVIKLDLILIN
jgi:hypothetical protein